MYLGVIVDRSGITFSNEPHLVRDSAEDIDNELLFAVPKGSTALLDAIYMGIERCGTLNTARRLCWLSPMVATTTAATAARSKVRSEGIRRYDLRRRHLRPLRCHFGGKAGTGIVVGRHRRTRLASVVRLMA